MKTVKFKEDYLHFRKGKTYQVTDRTAEKLSDKLAGAEKKEEKAPVETKEEKAPRATKTVKTPK